MLLTLFPVNGDALTCSPPLTLRRSVLPYLSVSNIAITTLKFVNKVGAKTRA